MKIVPHKLAEDLHKNQKRLEDFNIKIKPENLPELIKELEKAEQFKKRMKEIQKRKKKKIEQKKLPLSKETKKKIEKAKKARREKK